VNLSQAIHDGAQVRRAARSGNVVLDGAAIREQTDAVAACVATWARERAALTA